MDVSASSLYEAAVFKLKAFEQTGWADHPVGELEITVKSPAVKHNFPEFGTNGLTSSGTPREVALKSRLRDILGWNG